MGKILGFALGLLLIFSLSRNVSLGWTAEVVVPPGGPTRMGIPACPPNAVVVGFDAATGRLLCETGFFAEGGASWIESGNGGRSGIIALLDGM
jgi:hypothetical protein